MCTRPAGTAPCNADGTVHCPGPTHTGCAGAGHGYVQLSHSAALARQMYAAAMKC